jgi:hypothetical protein
VRRRRVVGGWWRGRLLATDGGGETSGEPVGTVRERLLRRQREALSALSVRFSGRRVRGRTIDPILIGAVGRWRSQEVFLVDSVCLQGPPRRAKSTVTSLGDETRKSERRTDQAGEEL